MDLALFDFDHTISFVDTYARFLRSTADPARRRRGELGLAPWVLGYHLGLVPAKRLRARATRAAFQGRSLRQVQEQGERYARQTLPALLRPDALKRIAWHQDRGDRVVVVSGSLDVYLQPWGEAQGLEFICNSLEAVDGILTGRYHPCDRASNKAVQIRNALDLGAFAAIHAYGDSHEDWPMLALAQHRWFRGRQIQ